MEQEIRDLIGRYYAPIAQYQEGAPNTRYKSWEWCHKAFREKRDAYWNASSEEEKEEAVDYLSLHLAFYLASWGMYRASAFLLQRDYKTHKKAVRILLEPQYDLLWDYEPSNNNIERATALLLEGERSLYSRVKATYKQENDIPTDTLVTKILLGSLGCVPAFDRFLKKGIALYKDRWPGAEISQRLNKQTFRALCRFIIRYRDSLVIPGDDQGAYPPMKCLDMFLWQAGFEMQ